MRLIDADALIAKYGDWYTEEGTEEGYIGTVRGIVDGMPAIESERKKGKWLEECMDYGECSECGFCGLTTDYCPSCGARMNNE